MSLRALSVFGTRPEAIKMAPVVRALERSSSIESSVCVTAQHRGLLDQVLELFELRPEFDLDLMTPGQGLGELTGRVLDGVGRVLAEARPDVVLVHGDTTTAFAAGLAAFYARIPVAHVEAGLRSGDLARPFPEEANRALVDRLSSLCYAPTESARDNLAAEGIVGEHVQVTGNTVVDALHTVREMVARTPASQWRAVFGDELAARLDEELNPLVLITGHRRENFGRGFAELTAALRTAAERRPEGLFVWPVHPNPAVRGPVLDALGDVENVVLTDPLDYAPFVWLMERSDLVVTDSGGIQEEAPALGLPVLVTREVTERPEAVEAGGVRLVGTDGDRLLAALDEVLGDADVYAAMATARSPYGDGQAARRIAESLERWGAGRTPALALSA